MPRIMVLSVLVLSACCNGQQLDPPTCAYQDDGSVVCQIPKAESWDRPPIKRRDLSH